MTSPSPWAPMSTGTSWDVRIVCRDVREVPEFLKVEIRHFFKIYKQLEPGKKTEELSWDDREGAEREIAESRDRYHRHRSHFGQTAD
jgi:inorganic pyrophosphatase